MKRVRRSAEVRKNHRGGGGGGGGAREEFRVHPAEPASSARKRPFKNNLGGERERSTRTASGSVGLYQVRISEYLRSFEEAGGGVLGLAFVFINKSIRVKR